MMNRNSLFQETKPFNDNNRVAKDDVTIQAFEENSDLLSVVHSLSTSVNKLVFHNSELAKMASIYGTNIGKSLFHSFLL